jgi:hypothetical protein
MRRTGTAHVCCARSSGPVLAWRRSRRSIGPPPEGYEGGGGRRRADITAVDFGYTGRRSRPAHSDLEQGHSQGDYEYDDYPDPLAEQYDWRSRGRSGNW